MSSQEPTIRKAFEIMGRHFALFALFVVLSACGSKGGSTTGTSAGTSSATIGASTKPKLDIVIFQDNPDSIMNALGQVKPQLQSFLPELNANWDFRFIVLPLQSTQALSAKYVVAADCSSVAGAAQCLSPSDASVFDGLDGDGGWIAPCENSWIAPCNQATSNLGFQNIQASIRSLGASGFIRSDAALSMVVISNGDDASGLSVFAYANWFQALKSPSALVRFYSVVAAQGYAACYGGGGTQAGTRYMEMAALGKSYDLCGAGLPNVLSELTSNLSKAYQIQ